MKFLVFLFSLVCSFDCFCQAINYTSEQVHELDKAACGTPPITFEDRIKGLKSKGKVSLNKNNGFTQLPIRAHIFRLDDGSGGLPLSDLNEALANLNNVYHPESIEWYLADVNYINSTAYYTFETSEEPAVRAAYLIDDAVNVFFANEVSNGSGAYYCGYAYYPANSDQSLCILMDNGCTSTSVNGTFVHEFGHHLSLPHTHNYTSNGNDHSLAEHVPRSGPQSNCSTDGDFICDTEADPTGPTSACIYTGGESDIYGNAYEPPVDNIMSYYSDACGGIFTPGQYTDIGIGLTSRLGHSAYDLDGAAPENVTNPSGLTATVNSNQIDLSWNDNANNETGFLIERSDDGGSTYRALPFGGVAANVTSFIDTDLDPFTEYRYRVKASNDDPDHYSNIIIITSERCYTASLQFNSGQLIQSPVDIPNLPVTAPTCQSVFPVTITVVGDFGASFEICDILGEDMAVLDQTEIAPADCNLDGATTSFNINTTQYNIWALNGTITFYIDANVNVGDFCSQNTVVACIEIDDCGNGSCPENYSGVNELTGLQVVSEDFETDGEIETSQSIEGSIGVTYDSGVSITFLPGFQNAIGSFFEAFIDGCGNLFKEPEEQSSDK